MRAILCWTTIVRGSALVVLLLAPACPPSASTRRRSLHIEHRRAAPLSVAHVIEGYEQIIDAARAQLRLDSDAPVVLTGWSRGASLGLLVASGHQADLRVIGLVAIGLVADEQLDLEGDDDEADSEAVWPATEADTDRKPSISRYPLLSRLGPHRFSGGESAFADALVKAVEWVTTTSAASK